jgi:hypothetical protein
MPRTLSAVEQLRSFIAKFDAQDQRLIRAVRAALRKRLPPRTSWSTTTTTSS